MGWGYEKRSVRYCNGNNVRRTDKIEGRGMRMMCSHEAIGDIDIKTNNLYYFVAVSILLHLSSFFCSTCVIEKKKITIIVTFNTLLSSIHYRRYPLTNKQKTMILQNKAEGIGEWGTNFEPASRCRRYSQPTSLIPTFLKTRKKHNVENNIAKGSSSQDPRHV